ncbi:MAG: hypothetical protein MZW92_57925 [Comamonadaceae bacterium]|nr:hypothetical protein [Comamonadaceae bacterium]
MLLPQPSDPDVPSTPESPLTLIPAPPGAFAWPTPDAAELPGRRPRRRRRWRCQVEGINGKIISGRLLSLDPVRGVAQLRVPNARAPLPLRFDQFRRLRLLDPLLACRPPTPGQPAPSARPRTAGARPSACS